MQSAPLPRCQTGNPGLDLAQANAENRYLNQGSELRFASDSALEEAVQSLKELLAERRPRWRTPGCGRTGGLRRCRGLGGGGKRWRAGHERKGSVEPAAAT